MFRNLFRSFFHFLNSNELKESIDYVNSWNFFSNIYNNILQKQGVLYTSTNYEYVDQIHKILKLKEIFDENFELVRLGRDYDGGYLVCHNIKKDTFSDNKIAYSLGISDDVSFDDDLADCGYNIFQYDHTIKKLPHKRDEFHWNKIGITGGNETSSLKRFDTLIKENGHEGMQGMFLKSDIEGFEWDMINNLDSNILKQFDQIVIEFHDLISPEADKAKILCVLNKLTVTHQLIHIHGNNFSYVSFDDNMVTPNVIEATFVLKTKFDFSDSNKVLPLCIDMPCFPKAHEIVLGKWNS